MADDRDDSQKTEQPTQKRLQEAEEKGDILQSPEIAAWFVLAAASVAIVIWGGSMLGELRKFLLSFLNQAHALRVTPETTGTLVSGTAFRLLEILAVPFAMMMVAAIAAHWLQHKPMVTLAKLKPDFSRLNLLKGFSRLFGMPALIHFTKGLLKTAAIATVIVVVIWPEREKLLGLIALPIPYILPLIQTIMTNVLMAALAVLAILAIADYAYQYFDRMRRLKMTRNELKDEFRQSEGDPAVKARLKQIRSARARKRMMSAVPNASVIITNPTHYAVALAYESGKMGAPVCVAKGVDHVALKIREIGQAHNVPIVENPPLARTLYASVDVDESIKPEHFKAVAQVIGFVMRLKNKASSARDKSVRK